MQDFILNDLPKQNDTAVLEKLLKCDTATVGHFMHGCFMSRDLQAIDPSRRVVGTAVTVKIPGPDSTLLHHVISDLREGDILVVDRCGDTKHACLGGGVALAASVRNIAGVIVDGPTTDHSEILANGVAVWSSGPSAITTKLLALGGEFNTNVSVGGVTVRPGDIILADESGALVLDPVIAEQVADLALKMQAEEIEAVQQIRDGAKLGELTGASQMIFDKMNAEGQDPLPIKQPAGV